MEACKHERAKRGPGSAHHWMNCADCGAELGLSITVEAHKRTIDHLAYRLECAKKEMVLCERWEAWLKAHPGAVIEA